MIFTQKLTLREYFSILLALNYRKFGPVIISTFGVVLIVVSLLQFAHIPFNKEIFIYSDHPLNQFFLGLLMLSFMPLFIYMFARRHYASHKILQSTITYTISGSNISYSGEHSQGDVQLDQLYKIVELKSFFLLYPSNKTVVMLKKDNLPASSIAELRNTFKELKEVIVKVKK